MSRAFTSDGHQGIDTTGLKASLAAHEARIEADPVLKALHLSLGRAVAEVGRLSPDNMRAGALWDTIVGSEVRPRVEDEERRWLLVAGAAWKCALDHLHQVDERKARG